MEGVKRNEVELRAHDERWEADFLLLKEKLGRILGEHVVRIEHVGSTAIKDIVAKPILDVAVVVKSRNGLAAAMTAAGYENQGDDVGVGRQFFVKRLAGEISTEHISLYPEKNPNFQEAIFFRDYLNVHADARQAYHALKIELAAKFADNRTAYTAAKSAFVKKILQKNKGNKDV